MVDRRQRPAALPSLPTVTLQSSADVIVDSSKVTAKLSTGDSVEVLLQGATVTSWKSNGRENLWISENAILDGPKPVRGGIPIVFPLFGPPNAEHQATASLSQHGFARNVRWEFLGKSTTESTASADGDIERVKLDFGLYLSALPEHLRKLWPYDFGLVYSVTLGPDGLQTIINVQNEGSETFEFQFLLHTYLRVADVSSVAVTGLLGANYIDKVLDGRTDTESADQLKINGETDRVYLSISQNTTSVLEGGKPRFDVVRDNLEDSVVWNPGAQKAAAIADFMPKDGWKNMLCVEVGSVNGWQKLDPGERYEAGQQMKAYR